MFWQPITVSAFLVLSLFSPFPSYAAAWTLPSGKWELYQNAFYYHASEFFDSDGHKQPQPDYTKYELNPYFEYGWTDSITLGAAFGLNLVQGGQLLPGNLHNRHTNYGIADPSFFLRQRFWNGDNSILSIQPLLKFPSHYTDSALPRSGSNYYDAELRLLGGHSFSMLKRTHFLNIEAAYRKRAGQPRNQLRFDFTLGITVNDSWQILPQLSLISRVKHKRFSTFTQTAEDDQDLLKPQLSAVYKLNATTSLQAGMFYHADGVNTGAGNGILFSLWYRP